MLSAICWAGDWSRQQLGQQQQQQEQQQLKQVPAAPAKALAAATAANGVGVALLQLQQIWQSPLRCPDAGVVTAQVQQQKRAAFLETALQLANNSLEATMYYLHSAYLLSDDPPSANGALDIAEQHLAHTLRRTKFAVQMAAAVRHAALQQQLQQPLQQQQQHGQALAACLQLRQQQQQLMQWQAHYMQTEDGEEVCSRWQPGTTQAS
uniref:Uncharacterized protein n=1 Tax=Tetradesmus obliquus TaxID=3088 RepID=A0A383VWJ6_TETOB